MLQTTADTNPIILYADRMLALVELWLRRLMYADDPDAVQELDKERIALEDQLEALRASNVFPDQRLAETFHLSRLELNVLWLAAAPWLEPSLRRFIARSNDNLLHDFVDAGLAMRILCATRPERLAAQTMFEAESPLQTSGLLRSAPRDVSPNNPMQHELVPGDHVVGFLRGSQSLSRALAPVARRLRPVVTCETLSLPDAVINRALPLIRGFLTLDPTSDPRFGPGGMDFARGAAFVFVGPAGSGRTLAMKAIAGTLQRGVIEVYGERLARMPIGSAQARLRLLFQEAELRGDIVAIRQADHVLSQESSLAPFLAEALSQCHVIVGLSVEDAIRTHTSLGPFVLDRIEVASGASAALNPIWKANLGQASKVDTNKLSDRMNLTGGQIRNASRLSTLLAAGNNPGRKDAVDLATLEASALSQLGSDMGHLAQVTWDERSFDDLIVDDETLDQIKEIVAAVENRHRIMRDWGLRAKLKRGIGICCLFDGEPGTGKTLAAEVVTSVVGLRLFRVNVPSVVDKYIGETEKNLSRIFERARPDTTVLLFDEADSLFSKRTEVSRSSDRYSNMEINVLLQLIERYEGVTVLTTNLKQSIDNAFERRITFKVNFPMPEDHIRTRIWKHLLPKELPRDEGVIYEYLAEMELSGGEIKNAIIRAAYAAAQNDTSVSMDHLFDAARREAAAAGRLVREHFDD